MNMIVRPIVTPEEFERMPGTEGYELIDGELREKAMGAESSRIQSRLNRRLDEVAERGDRAWVFDAECGYRCFPHRPSLVRKPDVSVVLRSRFTDGRVPKGYILIPPDLAVEVVSPHDAYSEVSEKVSEYLAVGVSMVWVVDPVSRTVHVYRENKVTRLAEQDHLTADPIIPSFRVLVADLFPNPPEPADDTPPPAG